MRTDYILTRREDQDGWAGGQLKTQERQRVTGSLAVHPAYARTTFSRTGSAFAIPFRSPAGSDASGAVSYAARRRRPSCSSFTPFGVAARRDTRLSAGSDARSTRPEDSSFSTSRVIVGGRTCSASASAPSVIGP